LNGLNESRYGTAFWIPAKSSSGAAMKSGVHHSDFRSRLQRLGELYGGVIRIQRQTRDVARLQAEFPQSVRVAWKSSNLDGLLRMLFFKGIGHFGEVLEFGPQMQPMIASDG
jgi:hypothetical protein